jgi:type II secretory ATPase GspE/PulE/Tfp pilus assembly ATPase PilB-like protein
MGIFEMMELNDELRQRIMANEDAAALTQAARRYGMRNLREDGWRKIRPQTSPQACTVGRAILPAAAFQAAFPP